MAYEHVYGIKLSEREAETHIRQKAAIQERLMSLPGRYAYNLMSPHTTTQRCSISRAGAHDFRVLSGHAGLDQQVDYDGTDYPLSDKFADLSFNRRNSLHPDPKVDSSAPKAPVERPKLERASTSTSGVSIVVPCEKISTQDLGEAAATTKKDSLATLVSSSSASQDREYKHWGRLDDPESVWNNLHVERPKLDERRRFSSYKEYKKSRNQPMKDNDVLFKKRVKQSFAKGEIEVLGIDESEDGDDEGEVATKAEPKRQILLVKRKGNLAGQNL